ncbi:MAG: type III-A CRISPR-associated RAMP protein Csm5 [Desulfobacteraceae bacterium]
MKLQMETLTSVHIGSGAELSPSEYWFDPEHGDVHRLNLESLTKNPDFLPHLGKFIQGAAQARQIERYIPMALLTSHILYSLPASGLARGHLAEHPTVIKAQILSGGRAYIPGSSIKGSLLSALLWDLLRHGANVDEEIHRALVQALEARDKKKSRDYYNRLLSIGLGRFCKLREDRFLKWLSVSDTNLIAVEGHLSVVLVQVVGARGGSQIPVLMETIRPGVNLVFELSFPTGGCQGREPILSLEKILLTANEFYRRIWAQTELTDPPSEGWLLRLGQGSGAWATSMLLLANDMKIADKYPVSPPRTRKLVDGSHSLGWVLLRPIKNNLPPPFPPPGEAEKIKPKVESVPPKLKPIRIDPVEKLTSELQLIKPEDAGRIGTIIQKIETLETPQQKAALARAIRDHLGSKRFKKHKKWDYLLRLIESDS